MTNLLKTTTGKIIAGSVLAAVILLLALIVYLCQPKFHDVTIELGSPMPALAEFQTDCAVSAWCSQKTPTAEIVLDRVGQQTVVLQHLFFEEKVTLTVQDTTKPQVSFRDVAVYIDELPAAKDFVTKVTDRSTTTISFKKAPTLPETYGDAKVEVLVTDASGNVTGKVCTISYTWLKPEFTLELGDKLEAEDLLWCPDDDRQLLNQADLDKISASSVGEYTLTSTVDGVSRSCKVTVVDTTAPALELKSLSGYTNESVDAEDFVKSVSDLSNAWSIGFAAAPDLSKSGTQTVTVVAVDGAGNRVEKTTELKLIVDAGPKFEGMSTLNVGKNAIVDFRMGISATDERDGRVDFTVDESKVDLSTAGTYYIVYKAVDLHGNETTYRRRINVAHDADDVAAMVSSIAAKLPADVEKIRLYVRNNIKYSYDWGGKDPTKGEPDPNTTYILYGFQNRKGNCYVHALCLDVLLREKGFETRLIWVTDQSHYWNMVKIDGTWYHIDSTPGRLHQKYSLMNDAMRYETLLDANGKSRDWDRTNPEWPVCP